MSSKSLLGHLVNNMMGNKKRRSTLAGDDETVMGSLKRKLVDSSDVLRSIDDTFSAYDGYKDAVTREAGREGEEDLAVRHTIPVRGLDFEAGASVDTRGLTIKLIQAAIAAGHADGSLDDDEQKAIMKALKKAKVNEEEEFFIYGEMENPRSIDELVDGIESSEDRIAMYGMARTTIVVDTEAESTFLEELADALDLSRDDVARIEAYLDGHGL